MDVLTASHQKLSESLGPDSCWQSYTQIPASFEEICLVTFGTPVKSQVVEGQWDAAAEQLFALSRLR